MRASMKESPSLRRTRLVLVNALTASRFALAPILCALIESDRLAAGLMVFGIVCLTDLFDGNLARRWGCTTKAGAVLDAAADLWYVLTASAYLASAGYLPEWYALVPVAKFIEFIVTSRYMRSGFKGNGTFVYDGLGRLAAVMFYTVPGIVLALRLTVANPYQTVLPILVAIATVAGISTVGRLGACLGRSIGHGGYLWTRSS